jgi:hypothetical protein
MVLWAHVWLVERLGMAGLLTWPLAHTHLACNGLVQTTVHINTHAFVLAVVP